MKTDTPVKNFTRWGHYALSLIIFKIVNYFNTTVEPTSKTPFQQQITALVTSVAVDRCQSLQLNCMGHLHQCTSELENIGKQSDSTAPETLKETEISRLVIDAYDYTPSHHLIMGVVGQPV